MSTHIDAVTLAVEEMRKILFFLTVISASDFIFSIPKECLDVEVISK